MKTPEPSPEFLSLRPHLENLQMVLKQQLEHVLNSSGMTLGLPIESRLKTWESIDSKLKRKNQEPKPLSDLDDLLGLRVIFLFERDLDAFRDKITELFKIHSEEDASDRLNLTQFGYRSRHYVISIPAGWKSVPSMSGLGDLRAEIQVRTLAQHIWAAASHKLQYKNEDGVPKPIRRSIHRLSALLELVDLELGRVLNDRDAYVQGLAKDSADINPLDVSVLEAVLDAELPSKNKEPTREDYGELLRNLFEFSIRTRGELQSLLRETMGAILGQENAYVDMMKDVQHAEPSPDNEIMRSRAARGVYFTHEGLTRHALEAKFGVDKVREKLEQK